MRRAALCIVLLAGCRNIVGIHDLDGDDGGEPATLTVVVAGGGRVRNVGHDAVLPDGSLDCPPKCRVLLPYDYQVELEPITNDGDGRVFSGWSERVCASIKQGNCVFHIVTDTTVTASFRPITHNLMFVSSQPAPPDLGPLSRYDTRCNALASGGGFNNAAGNAFIAWMSTTQDSASARLAGARGFERLDGAPLADVLDDPAVPLLNPILISDQFAIVPPGTVLTGTTARGLAAANNCLNWASADSGTQWEGGIPQGGIGVWTEGSRGNCLQEAPIYCVMKTLTTPLAPSPVPGKLMFVSEPEFSAGNGVAAAHALCQRDGPPGHPSGYKAMIATFGSDAIRTALQPLVMYVRPDGIPVGTGADIALGLPRSGIWQTGSGRYITGTWAVATGSLSPDVNAENETNCADWLDSSPQGNHMAGDAMNLYKFWSELKTQCTQRVSVYCAEQ